MKYILLILMQSGLATAAMAQSWTLDAPQIVPAPAPELPIYPYFPDGHISIIPQWGGLQMVWAGSTSYISKGPDIFHMSEARPVLAAGEKGSIDNGGAWLYSVFPQSRKKWLGFYHAEDHEFADDPTSTFTAWKSIALTRSNDGGRTWEKGEQILTSAQVKPAEPKWGGNGDFCVVWDKKKRRWMCFYQETFLCMATSSDPEAKAGTWKKWFKGSFSEPGLGGKNWAIPELYSEPGGNPSVHWNTWLKKWVMVWHSWEPANIWLSTSDDLENWASPQLVLASEGEEKVWYPTIFGESDQKAGKTAWLCYSRQPDKTKYEREFIARRIHFKK